LTSYLAGESLIDTLMADIASGRPPPSWPVGDPIFDHVEVSPGRVVLVAGPPGTGKTALFGQVTTGLLLSNPKLRVLSANVEMPADALLMRQLSRLSGIPLTAIRHRRVPACDAGQLDAAAEVLRSFADRIAFAVEPHRLDAIATAASDFRAHVLCLDYLQRIDPSTKADAAGRRKAGGLRERINFLMTDLRRIADKGRVAVLAAAAVSRSRDNKGRATYEGKHLSLASLRESGELEFGCDDCLILHPADDDRVASSRTMLLRHEKSRYGETKDLALSFHGSTQRFEVDPFFIEASHLPAPAANGVPPSDRRQAWLNGD
jgi:replicative DNA helicase